ncbi:MAG: hypothetical protein AAGH89_13325 [Verrucomicrobiota bacterium]
MKVAAEEIQFVETAELSRNDLLQELITIQDRARIKLEHHLKEASSLESRLERLMGLELKGYASKAEVQEACLNSEREELQIHAFKSIERMANEMVQFVSSADAEPATVRKPTLNLSVPAVTVDLAGIRLMGLIRPANQEFAQIAFDYVHGNLQNNRQIKAAADPSRTLQNWSQILHQPGSYPAEIRQVQRKLAKTETQWKLGGLESLMVDRDLQRLERFGRHLALYEDGNELSCSFPTLNKPLFLGAGENVLSLELSKASLGLILPVAAAMAAHTGPVLVQEARSADAERKLKWMKIVYDKGAASLREYEEARLESHVAKEVLQGMRAEFDARNLELSRLTTLAHEHGLSMAGNQTFAADIPSLDQLFTEIRSHWEASARSTSVLLGLANRFSASALAAAKVRETELEKEKSQTVLQKTQKLSKPRPSELERLESKLQQATAKNIDAAQKEHLRLLELRQWMKASELPGNEVPESRISGETIRLAKPVAEAKVLAAHHYRSARQIDRDYRRDLLSRVESLHQRGKARPSELTSARQVLAISEGRLESSKRNVQTARTEVQLIAGLIETSDGEQPVNLATPGGAQMQLIKELCHLELRPDTGVIKELQARLQQVETKRDKLVSLAARGYASRSEVTEMSEAVSYYAIALARHQGSDELGQLRSALVHQGLQPRRLLPVSGDSLK